jgi:hypothetical protein
MLIATPRRGAAACGLVSLACFIVNVAFTTEGPRPDRPAASEAARMAGHAGAVRASALLGVAQGVALGGMLVLLAMIADRRTSGRLVAVSSAAAVGVATVAQAVLAVVPQIAGSAGSPDLVGVLGDLHSTVLLSSFGLFGVALIAAGVATRSGALPVWSRWLGIAVGVCGVLASGALATRNFDLGSGPSSIFVALYFVGLPLWQLTTSVTLLVRRPPVGGGPIGAPASGTDAIAGAEASRSLPAEST